MAFSCPNKNHPDWKALVDKLGYKGAMLEYIKKGEIPDPSSYTFKATSVKMNDSQKKIYDDILAMQTASLSDDEQHYVVDGNLFTRVSTYLFGKTERSDVGELARQRGNVMHRLVELTILGMGKRDALDVVRAEFSLYNEDASIAEYYGVVKMDESTLGNFVDNISPWIAKKLKDGVVLLPEMVVYDKTNKIAGSIDITAINPDGTIEIYDLKTSGRTTKDEKYAGKTYKIKGEGGVYKAGEELSTKQKHTAQQTTYARMLEGLGHQVLSINIIPYHLQEQPDGGVVFIKELPIPLSMDEKLANELIDDTSLPERKKVAKPSVITWTSKILDDITIFLEQRLIRAKNHRTEAGVQRVSAIQSQLREVEDAKKVVKFIDLAHNELTGEKGLTKRFEAKVTEVKEKVEKGEMNPAEAITALDVYKIYAEGYHVLDSIFDSVDADYDTLENDSTIKKLESARRAKNKIISNYRSASDVLIAKWLAEQASDAVNQEAMKQIGILNSKIELTKKSGAKAQQAKYEKQRQVYMDSIATEDTLVQALSTIRQDVPTADYWLEAIASSGNIVLSLFAKQVKKYFEDMRVHLMEFARVINNEYEIYEKARGYTNDAAKFNEGLYEIRKTSYKNKETGEWEEIEQAAFVDRTDWNKYKEAKRSFLESLAGKEGREAAIAMAEWSKKNNEAMSRAEMEEIIADNRAIMDDITFAEWVKDSMFNEAAYRKYSRAIKQTGEDNVIEYAKELMELHSKNNGSIDYLNFKGDLHKPSLKNRLYYNEAYAQFEESAPDTPIKRYYKFLTNKYLTAQKRLPRGKRRGLFLPSVPKNDSDRLIEQKFQGIAKIAKEAFNYSAEDEATMEYRSLDGKDKTLPIRYVSTMKASDVSLNLASSIAQFEASTLKYEQSTKLMPMVNATLDLVKNAEVLNSNAAGANKVDAVAKKLGINDKYVKKNGDNIAAAWMESFVDMQIFGAMSEKESWNGIDTGKVTDTLLKATSLRAMAGDWMKGVANSLQANAMLMIEAFAGEHITKSSLATAKKKYLKHAANGSYIKDSLKPFNESFIGQLTDYYDGIQGKYMDEYGKELGWRAAKKFSKVGTLFGLMNMGEHEVQTTMMLGMMQEYKLKLGGKEISLDEAYELVEKDGIKVLSLKAGVTKLDGTEYTEQDRFDFMEKMHGINKRLHGIYNSFDRVHAKRFALTRAMMLFRNFLYPGLKRRYKGLSSDQEIGGFTEGYYVTWWNNMGKDLLTLKWDNIAKWDDLSDTEKANMKRFYTEAAMIVITFAMVAGLTMLAAGTDDDDFAGFLIHSSLYFAKRLNSEVFAYINPIDFMRITRSPSAATSTLETTFDLFYYLSVDPMQNLLSGEEDVFSRYKRETGKFEKGDLKLNAAFQKLFGLHGRTYNPEEAVKILNFTR